MQHIHFFLSAAATSVYEYKVKWLITVMVQQLEPSGISAEILRGEGQYQA